MSAPSGQRAYGAATLILSSLMVVIGVGLIVRTAMLGGGVVSIGVIMGLLFVAAGCGRLWVAWRGR